MLETYLNAFILNAAPAIFIRVKYFQNFEFSCILNSSNTHRHTKKPTIYIPKFQIV